MKKSEKVDFDLSELNLEQLIEAYENIDDFIKFLEGSKYEESDGNEDE